MLLCYTHSTCEHHILFCQCIECWTHCAQCPDIFDAETPDTPLSSTDGQLDVARPNRNKRRLSILREQSRNEDLYCTETLHNSSDFKSPTEQHREQSRRGNFIIETGDYPCTQLSICPRTLKELGFHFPTPGTEQWKRYISLLNQHQQSEIEERSNRGFIKSIRRKLFTKKNMDTNRISESTTKSVRNRIDRFGIDDNNSETGKSNQHIETNKSTMVIQSEGIPSTQSPGEGTSNGSRKRRSTSQEGGGSGSKKKKETSNIEQNIQQEESENESTNTINEFLRRRGDEPSNEPSDRPDRKKQYYTFIIHKKNQETTWRQSGSRAKQTPCYISFDHGDHYHIIFSSDPTGGNAARQRTRITKHLGCTAAGSAESISTFSRINLLRNFILYCIRYGIETVNIYGNKINNELIEAQTLFQTLFSERDPNEVIRDIGCKKYIEDKKEEKQKRIVNNKRNNIVDVITDIINEKDIWTAAEWNMKVDIETKNQLMREFGLNVESYVTRIIRNKKHTLTGKLKRASLVEILMEVVQEELKNIQKDDDTIPSDLIEKIEWLEYLIKENEIDMIDFLTWNECIKDMRYIKINSLVLQGPTNAGKSLIADTLLGPIRPEEIPRERDNSGFHLDQLPEASAALFEEPLITPVNVGTWKLLLEGKTIKTDIKHRDKEGIKRLPIYITSATKITGQIDQYEANQVNQRIKIYEFIKTIEHRKEKYTNILCQRVQKIKKAPGHIQPIHFAILYLLKWNQIQEKIEELDKELQVNPEHIPLTEEICQQANDLQTQLQRIWILTKMGMPLTKEQNEQLQQEVDYLEQEVQEEQSKMDTVQE